MSVRPLKDKVREDMRREQPVQSMLGVYLHWMRREDPYAADSLEADLALTFQSDAGLRVLKLFEKSVLLAGIPNGVSDSALRETNAVRNFVLEIRRLVAHAG
jgi:hypothetical protein